MARHRRTRWVVTITAEDNGQHETFGPWYDLKTAKEISDQATAESTYYNSDAAGGEFLVQVSELKPWPGIRAFRRGG